MKPRIRISANGTVCISYFDSNNIPDDWLTTILLCWVEHLRSNITP